MKKSILFGLVFSLFLGGFSPLVGEVAEQEKKAEQKKSSNQIELSEYRKCKFFERHCLNGAAKMNAFRSTITLLASLWLGSLVLKVNPEFGTSTNTNIPDRIPHAIGTAIILFLLAKYFILNPCDASDQLFFYHDEWEKRKVLTPKEFHKTFENTLYYIKRHDAYSGSILFNCIQEIRGKNYRYERSISVYEARKLRNKLAKMLYAKMQELKAKGIAQ
jgi:hypothetical protein